MEDNTYRTLNDWHSSFELSKNDVYQDLEKDPLTALARRIKLGKAPGTLEEMNARLLAKECG